MAGATLRNSCGPGFARLRELTRLKAALVLSALAKHEKIEIELASIYIDRSFEEDQVGMFDNVVALGEPLACPAGHPLSGLQTKSFRDPSMSTYLIAGGRVLVATRSAWHDDRDEDERSAWRITGDEAVHESHYRLEPMLPPADVRVYTHCAHCEPVLARTDRASLWGDIVQEHRLFVEFSLQFPDGEPMTVRRVSGGRDELMDELRRSGLRVLEDDEPLAVAHREILRAKEAARTQKAGRRAY